MSANTLLASSTLCLYEEHLICASQSARRLQATGCRWCLVEPGRLVRALLTLLTSCDFHTQFPRLMQNRNRNKTKKWTLSRLWTETRATGRDLVNTKQSQPPPPAGWCQLSHSKSHRKLVSWKSQWVQQTPRVTDQSPSEQLIGSLNMQLTDPQMFWCNHFNVEPKLKGTFPTFCGINVTEDWGRVKRGQTQSQGSFVENRFARKYKTINLKKKKRNADIRRRRPWCVRVSKVNS